jgi:predicted nucleotidyltransferase
MRKMAEMEPVAIDLPRNEIAEFCRRHKVTKLALFGSVSNL